MLPPSLQSKKFLGIIFLLVLIIGVGLTVFQVQKQLELRQRAATVTWATTQSAIATCGTSASVLIQVSFTNEETNQAMNVVATDEQTNQSVNLGVVEAGKTSTGTIDTKLATISAGTVIFHLAWTNSSPQTDTRTASYNPVASCSNQPPVCTDESQSVCLWDALSGVSSYSVVIKDASSGAMIKSGSVTAPTTSFTFPSQPGNTYQCTVNAVSVCGTGQPTSSQPLTCPLPTPTPTAPVCQNQSLCLWDSLPGATSYNVSIINNDTGNVVSSGSVLAPSTQFPFPYQPGVNYVCKVNAINICGTGNSSPSQPISCGTVSPTPTEIPTPTVTAPTPTTTPLPTVTSYPTVTPAPTQTPYPTYTPAPTPTPIVIVQVTQLPPQIVYQQVPGQTVIQQQGSSQNTPLTPQPTIAETGNATPTALFAGISVLLLTAGGLLAIIF